MRTRVRGLSRAEGQNIPREGTAPGIQDSESTSGPESLRIRVPG